MARLESQVIRYKSAAETSEKVEDELKVEKRKLQREVWTISLKKFAHREFLLNHFFSVTATRSTVESRRTRNGEYAFAATIR